MGDLQGLTAIPKLTSPAKRVFLSLGSNLGDRVDNIRKALEQMPEAGIEIKRVSSFYRTEPVDFRPQAWFVNCVAEAMTHLMPMQLLKAVKLVERALGRRPALAKRPRVIDIDILLYESVVMRSAALNIPHERMAQRRFVLLPLRELAGNLRHPISRRTVLEMLAEAGDTSQVVRMKV
ncbi:MAG TPA: 2-amino-4-hydroxy-6-hydroxymethyldihydropteridine diphosphokinase [Terriglobia bacterium]|nr:2-amino-4-hydroxy-6-hydroxymethyldihydropteridine diphosphokinase [Terriglobia bacterium]